MRFKEYTFADNAGAVRVFRSSKPSGKRKFWEHQHTEFEISVIISGSGIYRINGRDYEFEKGDVFILGSDELHCFTDIFYDEKFEILSIKIEPRFLWADRSLNNSEILKVFYARNEHFKNRLDRKNPATAQIREKIFEVEREFEKKDFEYALSVKLLILEILIMLAREYDYVKKDGSQMHQKEVLKQLEAAMKYIDEHIGEKITLDMLAKTAFMNRSYFSTVFKKFNGISPWEYITIKRVEQAIFLVKTSDFTKTEIAARCGFSGMANFYKAFKKVTGKVPSDFEEQLNPMP